MEEGNPTLKRRTGVGDFVFRNPGGERGRRPFSTTPGLLVTGVLGGRPRIAGLHRRGLKIPSPVSP